jgi:hypothetical protein
MTGSAGTATAGGEATPTAAGQNAPPVAAPDEATTADASSVTIPVLANDTDDGLGRPEGEEPHLSVVGLRSETLDRFTFSPTDVTFTAGAGDAGSYLAEYDVSDGELVATAQVTVRVPAATRAVTITMPERPVTLERYAITGTVQPLTDGPAEVRVQRRTADGWTGHAKDTTDSQGNYSVGFRTATPGKRTFRAVAVWPDGPKATSERLSRTIRAVADPVVTGPLTPSDVPYSWRSGCPVPPSQLRKIHVNRLDYRRHVARGAIVVRAGEVDAVVKLFKTALRARFPIRSLRPADRFYGGGRRTPTGSDKAAMRAGNTSGFNCRPVTGNPYRISQHSYGNAVDINTIENPYVTAGAVYPAGSRKFLDRSPYRRGMIVRGSVIADRMRRLGWHWGARWSHPDYQHFSSNGG